MNPLTAYRLLGGALVALVAGVLGWYLFGPGPGLSGSFLYSGGVQWEVREVHSAKLWGKTRLDLTLFAARGPAGQVKLDPPLLRGLCGAALVGLHRLGLEGARRDIFQVRLSILGAGLKPVGAAHIPVGVSGGSCRLDARDGLLYHRYPAPLDKWVLVEFRGNPGASKPGIEARFVWAGNGPPQPGDFAFDRACEAVLAMSIYPPVVDFLKANPQRLVTISVATDRRFDAAGSATWLSHVFDSSGQACKATLGGTAT